MKTPLSLMLVINHQSPIQLASPRFSRIKLLSMFCFYGESWNIGSYMGRWSNGKMLATNGLFGDFPNAAKYIGSNPILPNTRFKRDMNGYSSYKNLFCFSRRSSSCVGFFFCFNEIHTTTTLLPLPNTTFNLFLFMLYPWHPPLGAWGMRRNVKEIV